MASSLSSPSSMKFVIKKLEGASNYLTWRASIKVYLDYHDVLEIATGDISEPSTNTMDDKYLVWKKKDKTARLLILTCVSQDWVHLVAGAQSSHAAWIALKDKFDRQNTVSVHNYLRIVINRKMTNSQSISEYLTEVDQNWLRLKQRVLNSSNDKLAQGLNVFLYSDTVKSSFLLLSLHESLSTQVDNLLLRKDQSIYNIIESLLFPRPILDDLNK
jgi:hypothetical protein